MEKDGKRYIRTLDGKSELGKSPLEKNTSNNLVAENRVVENDIEKQNNGLNEYKIKTQEFSPTLKSPSTNASERSIERVGEPIPENISVLDRDVDRKFVIDDKGSYRWRENVDVVAFREKTKNISTQSKSPLVAKAMVAVAESRGWSELNVKGNDNFKREIWLEANLRGIEVKGYSPTEQDKINLESKQNVIEKSDDRKASVKVDTLSNNTKKDFKQTTKKDEYVNAFDTLSRQDAIRKYPELDKFYNLDRAAKEFSDSRINNSQSQKDFMTNIRERAFNELSKGQSLPNIQNKSPQNIQEKETEK
jgi:hypothetical protein